MLGKDVLFKKIGLHFYLDLWTLKIQDGPVCSVSHFKFILITFFHLNTTIANQRRPCIPVRQSSGLMDWSFKMGRGLHVIIRSVSFFADPLRFEK